MSRILRTLAASFFLVLAVAQATEPLRAEEPMEKPQFLYILRLVPRLHGEAVWTEADNAAVGAHFQRLAQATAAGQVILAGRTTEAPDLTMGLVVFEAEDEAAAKAFMESDPAVVAGVMTATLHPYKVALLRK